jgi:hydroxymethylglutaryl-CoA synthase
MTMDAGGSQKCATGALIQSLRSAAPEPTLCIASERARARPGSEAELVNGDAAAALVVGSGPGIARLLGSHSVAVDFVDHFRGRSAEYDHGWESRWIRDEGYARIAGDAVRAALAKLGLAGKDIHRFVVPIPVKGVPDSLARTAGIAPGAVQDTLAARLGHAGSAQPLVLLAHALAHAGPQERIVVLGFGQGCDVLVFETTDRIASHAHPRGVDGWLARGRPEHNYFKQLAFTGAIDLERGMRAEFEQKQPLTALYRNRKTVLGLVGARDTVTGAVQYPRTEVPVGAANAQRAPMDDWPLAEKPARVLTHTADSLAYTPDPPGCYGMLEFEGGGRMQAEFTDAQPSAIEVGLPMRMTFRIKSVDERRDFVKYFWKAAPAA